MSAKEGLGRIRVGVGMIAVAAACLLVPSAATAAPVFNVTTTSDQARNLGGGIDCVTTGDTCTLRAAVQDANDEDGDVTINVPQGTYKLTIAPTGSDDATTGDLNITDLDGTVTINHVGPGTTTIDGNGSDRIFNVGSDSKLAVSGVTMTNGLTGGTSNGTSCPTANLPSSPVDGGAILTAGGLTLTNDVVTSNIATGNGGGIQVIGTTPVSLTDTTVSNNKACPWGQPFLFLSGGGINEAAAGGQVTVDHSTITGNQAVTTTGQDFADGGGVAEEGNQIDEGGSPIIITNTTISDNTAENGGGVEGDGSGSVTMFADTLTRNSAVAPSGTFHQGNGGGVQNGFDTVTITNTTITGNNASTGGGVWSNVFDSEPTVISYSTINANTASDGTGNLFAQASESPKNNAEPLHSQPKENGGFNIDDTIVTAGVGTDGSPSNCGGGTFAYTDNGNNLFDDSGANCSGPVSGDLTNTNPKLGPLQGNGGPTQTEALQSGSPAIDTANDTLCSEETRNAGGQQVDERGVTRPQINHCDIGAFEFVPSKPIPPPVTPPAKQPVADVAVKKTVSPGTTSVGAKLTYTLRVVNHGPNKATHVKLTDKLPSTLSFDSVSTDRGSCSGGQTVTCELGKLHVGQHATVTIVATAQAAVTIRNRAVVAAKQHDPHLENNHSTAVAGVAMQHACVRRIHSHAVRLQPGRPFTALVYANGKLILAFQGTHLPLGQIKKRSHDGIVHVLLFQGGTKQVFELDFSHCQRANIALE